MIPAAYFIYYAQPKVMCSWGPFLLGPTCLSEARSFCASQNLPSRQTVRRYQSNDIIKIGLFSSHFWHHFTSIKTKDKERGDPLPKKIGMIRWLFSACFLSSPSPPPLHTLSLSLAAFLLQTLLYTCRIRQLFVPSVSFAAYRTKIANELCRWLQFIVHRVFTCYLVKFLSARLPCLELLHWSATALSSRAPLTTNIW